MNATDEYGRTAFYWSCMYGKIEIMEMLIDNSEFHKLDLTSKDKWNRTVLQKVKREGNVNVINLIKNRIPSLDL